MTALMTLAGPRFPSDFSSLSPANYQLVDPYGDEDVDSQEDESTSAVRMRLPTSHFSDYETPISR